MRVLIIETEIFSKILKSFDIIFRSEIKEINELKELREIREIKYINPFI